MRCAFFCAATSRQKAELSWCAHNSGIGDGGDDDEKCEHTKQLISLECKS